MRTEINVLTGEVSQQEDAPSTPTTQQQLIDADVSLAKQLIAACDWSVLPDVGLANKADFTAYRAALRDIIINPVIVDTWPNEPVPYWESK